MPLKRRYKKGGVVLYITEHKQKRPSMKAKPLICMVGRERLERSTIGLKVS